MVAVDPVISLAVSALLIAVFGAALTHKLSGIRVFQATLGEYHLLPGWVPTGVLWPLAWLLVAAEGAVCVTLAVQTTRAYGAALAVILLALYSFGIALNLARGRRDMDCGCTWGTEQSGLSGWLLVRNTLLILLAGLMTIEPLQRPMHLTDWLFSGCAALALVLLYFAAERLIGNWGRLRTLRLR